MTDSPGWASQYPGPDEEADALVAQAMRHKPRPIEWANLSPSEQGDQLDDLAGKAAGEGELDTAALNSYIDEQLAKDDLDKLDEQSGLDQRDEAGQRDDLDKLDQQSGLDQQSALDEQSGLDQRVEAAAPAKATTPAAAPDLTSLLPR